jgi:hypothetical protein
MDFKNLIMKIYGILTHHTMLTKIIYWLKKLNEQFLKLEHFVFAGFTHQAAI